MDDSQNQPSTFAEMAAALNDHQVTDDLGQVADDTANQDTASDETNTVEETASAEKPAETEEVAPATQSEETETELAADETGKRYVPESRFKEVYAQKKQLERELEESRAKDAASRQNVSGLDNQPLPAPSDRTEALEVELLKTTLPQFNPESPEYDKTLDEMGAEIYRANPGITRVEAAKRAVKRASELTRSSAAVKAEARQVKSLQSDQGITSRVEKRAPQEPDFNKMNDKELEAYLRETGQW